MRNSLGLCLLALCALAPVSLAAAELTEARAIELGLVNIQNLLEARQQEARGRAETIGRWDNPEVEYSREAVDLPDGDSEERTWWLRQRLPLAGSKGLQRDAAQFQAQADVDRIELYRREVLADIRERFYRALAAEHSAQTLEAFHDRLQELIAVLRQRLQAGEASRYDLLRLEQEGLLAQSELLTATARASGALEQLSALLGSEPQDLVGTLLPPAADNFSPEVVVASHPSLKALRAEAESAALNAKAASREIWPEVTLGVGRRTLEEPHIEAGGNTFSLGVEVPLFQRGQGDERLAQSLARQRRASYELAAAQLLADLRSKLQTLAAEREAASSLGENLSLESGTLSDIAEEAYQAGELSVAELIDAHRSELNTRQAYINRALNARHTYIQLQALRNSP